MLSLWGGDCQVSLENFLQHLALTSSFHVGLNHSTYFFLDFPFLVGGGAMRHFFFKVISIPSTLLFTKRVFFKCSLNKRRFTGLVYFIKNVSNRTLSNILLIDKYHSPYLPITHCRCWDLVAIS